MQPPEYYFKSDTLFDRLFPKYIQQLSERHWTPLDVAKAAAIFLAPDENASILDIGAGAGKFCIVGASHTAGKFTGIEQRKNFVNSGNRIIKKLGLERAKLVHGNFMELDMGGYNGIYFYNSFHENIVIADSLDTAIERSPELYELYSAHLEKVLTEMPVGTRLATYYLYIHEVPSCYKLKGTDFDNLLKLWVKES